MNTIWILTKRELSSFFDTLTGYITLVLFLGFTGFFTWINADMNVFIRGQASLDVFFNIAYWTLFFFIPALTMRQIAEEKRSGTIEWLLTRPVTDRQVVIGKFLATLLLILIALLFTLPYFITVANIGNVDQGAVISGYLGLLLLSAAYISIGLFASSITNNQIVAIMAALFIGIFFHLLFGIFASSMTGWPAQVLNYLNLSYHFDSISRGVIDSKDLIYFISITVLGLYLTEISLAKRNIAE